MTQTIFSLAARRSQTTKEADYLVRAPGPKDYTHRDSLSRLSLRGQPVTSYQLKLFFFVVFDSSLVELVLALFITLFLARLLVVL